MPRKKRVLSEIQKIQVKKFDYVDPRASERVEQPARDVRVRPSQRVVEDRKPGLFARRKKRNPTQEAEEFLRAIDMPRE